MKKKKNRLLFWPKLVFSETLTTNKLYIDIIYNYGMY